MNRLLIALDMDGTLLTSKKKISWRTKRILQKLQKEGHLIVLASGRPSRALLPYYNQLGLTSPIICYNGAYVFSPTDPTFKVEEFEFPKEIVKEIYNELSPKYIKNVMCENDKQIWLDKKDIYLAKFFWYEGMKMNYGSINEILTSNPMTMIMQSNLVPVDQEAIKKAVLKHQGINVRFWGASPYCEIYFEKTSKGASVSYIAEQYGIKKENIIAFGDADNDIELLQCAGISVSMCNGMGIIKEKAKMESVKDNDHDGIYYTLKKIIKEKKKELDA